MQSSEHGAWRGAEVRAKKCLATVVSKYLGTHGFQMGEIISLRRARKQAKREAEAERAATNRLVHGRSKAQRKNETASAEQARRHLDAHKIDTGETR
jgi:hypothetical protein